MACTHGWYGNGGGTQESIRLGIPCVFCGCSSGPFDAIEIIEVNVSFRKSNKNTNRLYYYNVAEESYLLENKFSVTTSPVGARLLESCLPFFSLESSMKNRVRLQLRWG